MFASVYNKVEKIKLPIQNNVKKQYIFKRQPCGIVHPSLFCATLFGSRLTKEKETELSHELAVY